MVGGAAGAAEGGAGIKEGGQGGVGAKEGEEGGAGAKEGGEGGAGAGKGGEGGAGATEGGEGGAGAGKGDDGEAEATGTAGTGPIETKENRKKNYQMNEQSYPLAQLSLTSLGCSYNWSWRF